MKTQPWWKLKDKPALLEQLLAYSGIHASAKRRWQDHQMLAACYYRDKLLARFGSGAAAGHALRGLQLPGSMWDSETSLNSPNIVASAVNTVVAWIFSDESPVGIAQAGVPFERRFAALDYESALDSMYNNDATQAEIYRVARDAALSGTGCAWPVYDNGDVCVRHLHPWQVVVDPREAASGRPRSVHVTEDKDRDCVVAWALAMGAPKSVVGDIEDLPAVHNELRDMIHDVTAYDENLAGDSDRIYLQHSWRVATSREAEDGRYVVLAHSGSCAEAVVVLDVPFCETSLPVVFFAPNPDDRGVYGTGFGHMMLPYQESIDKSMMKNQSMLDNYGHHRLLVHGQAPGRGEGDTTESTADQIMAMAAPDVSIVYTDQPIGAPQWIEQSVIRTEDLQWIKELMAMSEKVTGLNSMMSQGTSQLGAAASGAAQQEEYYRSLDRWTPLVACYQRFRLRLAEETLRVLDSVLELNPDYSACFNWYGGPRECTWRELTEQLRGVTIKVELRGQAATGRAGRIARIQEQAGAGLVDGDTAREALLTTPDVRRANQMASAGFRLVEWQIRYVIEGEHLAEASPDKDTPLGFAVQRARQYLQLGRVQGAEPETLERLRGYIYTAEAIQQEMMPAPMPGELPVPGPEAGMPGATM